MSNANWPAKEILAAICDYQQIELTYSEAKDALDDIATKECDDFWFELDGYEFRIIAASQIDQIWTDSLIEQIQDCYDGLNDLPEFVEIDWEATAENCKVDGMGHHFSSYDGSEHESSNFHYFLTNA